MVKIRLTRLGDIHSPFYRVVVADSRNSRDGGVIDLLGTYDPLKTPAAIKIDLVKAEKWVKNGAQPTETAKSILIKAGFKFPEKKKKAKKAAVAHKKEAAPKAVKASAAAKPEAKPAPKAPVKKPTAKKEG